MEIISFFVLWCDEDVKGEDLDADDDIMVLL